MRHVDLDGIDCWIFDLDNTLYPPSAELFRQIDRAMTDFIQRELSVERHEANHLRAQYWRDHGTTLAGMMKHHSTDPGHFLSECHAIDYAGLRSDPNLSEAIQRLPGRKIVHTNGPRCHATAVLTELGYSDLFDRVFALEDTALVSKPAAAAFHTVFSEAAITPSTAAMIEDDARNLAVPYDMAVRTIWVDHAGSDHCPAHVHHRTRDLVEFLTPRRGRP
ncbi:MAG: pyrimidine 5'-nucleotidase [Pseudomonadota bacterium]